MASDAARKDARERSLGGAALLAHVLPSEVVTLLDDHLAAVVGVSES